jgi:hypothetical protein
MHYLYLRILGHHNSIHYNFKNVNEITIIYPYLGLIEYHQVTQYARSIVKQ